LTRIRSGEELCHSIAVLPSRAAAAAAAIVCSDSLSVEAPLRAPRRSIGCAALREQQYAPAMAAQPICNRCRRRALRHPPCRSRRSIPRCFAELRRPPLHSDRQRLLPAAGVPVARLMSSVQLPPQRGAAPFFDCAAFPSSGSCSSYGAHRLSLCHGTAAGAAAAAEAQRRVRRAPCSV